MYSPYIGIYIYIYIYIYSRARAVNEQVHSPTRSNKLNLNSIYLIYESFVNTRLYTFDC
jgi:hypothetical protein